MYSYCSTHLDAGVVLWTSHVLVLLHVQNEAQPAAGPCNTATFAFHAIRLAGFDNSLLSLKRPEIR